MFELTVKTLDGRDHAFTLPEEISIAQFKQQIARSLEIPVDQQRLIFRGKMLTDETILKADEMDHKVVHLVTRAPPSIEATSSTPENRHVPGESVSGISTDVPGIVVGEINIASFIPPNRIQDILRYVIESVGINTEDTNFTVTDRGRGIEIQIEVGANQDAVMRREIAQRLVHIRHMITLVNRQVDILEQHYTNENITVFQPCVQESTQQQSDVSIDTLSNETSQTDASASVNVSVEQSLSDFDSILQDFYQLNNRISRVLDRYSSIVSRSIHPPYGSLPNQDQQVFTSVPTMMHLMSHIYHNISDLLFIAATADTQPSLSIIPAAQESTESVSTSQQSSTFDHNQNAFELDPLTQLPSQTQPSHIHNELSFANVRQQMMTALSDAINPLLGNSLVNSQSEWRQINLSEPQQPNDRRNNQPATNPTFHNDRRGLQRGVDERAFRSANISSVRLVNGGIQPNRTMLFNQMPNQVNDPNTASGSVPITNPIQINGQQNIRIDRNIGLPRPTIQIIRTDGLRNAIPLVSGHIAYSDYSNMQAPRFYNHPVNYNPSYPSYVNGNAYPQYMHYPQIPMQYSQYPYPFYPIHYRPTPYPPIPPYQFFPGRLAINRPYIFIRQTPPVPSTNEGARNNVNNGFRPSSHRSQRYSQRAATSLSDRSRQQLPSAIDPYLPCFTGTNLANTVHTANAPPNLSQSFSQSEQMIANVLAQILPPLFNSGRDRVNVIIGSTPNADMNTATVTTAASSSNLTVINESNAGTPQRNAQHEPAQTAQNNAENDTSTNVARNISTNETIREISAIIESDIDQQQTLLRESHLNVLSLASVLDQIQYPHLYASSGDGIFNECLLVLLHSITFGDFIHLMNGNYRDGILEHCIEKLANVLSKDRVCPINRKYRNYFIARQLADVLLKLIHIDENTLGVHQDVSFRQTMQCFFRYSMYRLICAIMVNDAIASRRTKVLDILKSIFSELRGLLCNILINPQQEFHRLQNGHLIFPNIPANLAPLMDLFTRVLPKYTEHLANADDVTRYIIPLNEVFEDNEISTIVEIDRLNIAHSPFVRSRSRAYQSMIPYKRRRSSASLNEVDNTNDLHRIVLQRVSDIINNDRDDQAHPPMRLSVLEIIRNESENRLGRLFCQFIRNHILHRIRTDNDFEMIADRYPNLRSLQSTNSNHCTPNDKTSKENHL